MFSITTAIRIASNITRTTATLHAWRITNKKDRALLERAVRMTEEGKGYIIATAEQLGMKKDGRNHIWCIDYYPRRYGRVGLVYTLVR